MPLMTEVVRAPKADVEWLPGRAQGQGDGTKSVGETITRRGPGPPPESANSARSSQGRAYE